VAAEVAPLTSPESEKSAAKIVVQRPASKFPNAASPEPDSSDSDGSSSASLASSSEAALESSARLSPQDAVDFLLHPTEMARGRTAAENYLNTCRNEESRRFAEEALETLATVISGGHCDTLAFPWQQVRPFHGAAALTILKEKGAPARIETLRCRRDTTRSYRVMPESYPPNQVQKIRTTLTKVIEKCSQLGFVSDVALDSSLAPAEKKNEPKKTKRAPQGRLLGDGELRALGAACTAFDNTEGHRDAAFFAFVNRGLKISEITALTVESVRFNNKTGVCQIVSSPARGNGRKRRIELENEELICLEDWLDRRGDADGPLLCTLGRAGKIEGKRLTMATLKEICERRAKQAEVKDFVPNDLSRSADALIEHRKAVRKKVNKQNQSSPSTANLLLYDGQNALPDKNIEAIRFPFMGLGI
jgi:integrase